ncbi:helix-turn-helix domain-containing protein [bacterium SCSIO 12741]|nr:helix-turn-helix domain-containing protein [bacterium SCSIO 12741]
MLPTCSKTEQRAVTCCSRANEEVIENLCKVIESQAVDPHFEFQHAIQGIPIHATCFAQNLKKLKGCTPRTYLAKIRLRHAAALLRTQNLPIKNVAWQSGFRSYSYFWQVFKETFGCSPTTYRNRRSKALKPEVVHWKLPLNDQMKKSTLDWIQQDSIISAFFQTYLSDTNKVYLSYHELADQLRLSRSQLGRKLKKCFGVPPMKLVFYLKLLIAMESLNNESLSVTEVAYRAGFFDQAHLCRALRETLGLSPTEYRKNKPHQQSLKWLRESLNKNNPMN